MLEVILEQKNRVKEAEAAIKKLEEEAGLPELRKQLKAMQNTLEAMLAEAVLKNVMEEGTLRVISAGRVMRVIRVSDFKERFPDLFEEYATVPITPVVDALIQQHMDDGFPKKEAKTMAEEELSDVLDMKQTEKWDILDMVGDVSGPDH
jgi:hypothetical protein